MYPISELNGGSISAKSTKNIGSCFTFTLPSPPVDDRAIIEATDPIARTNDQLLNRTQILLIENESPYYEQIQQECHRFGIRCINVKRVEQALTVSQKIDVIVYCQVPHVVLVPDVAALQTQFSKNKLLICQHHLQKESLAFLDIHTHITLPFLGKRFKNQILNIVSDQGQNQLAQDDSNVVSHGLLSRRILVVEDNLMNQKIASFFLEKAGYEYEITSNGQEAVDEITQGARYDAILMDCMMPVMDGLTATKKIREWEEEKGIKKLPIIALTASVLDEDIKHCFDAGMDAYLPKPYKSQQLFDLFDDLRLA